MNPVEEFFDKYGHQKTAFWGDAYKSLQQATSFMPEQVTQGLATAGSAALVAGAGVGISKIYGAATKARDFRKMLSFNEDLAEQHKQNPKYINASFSTLRRMNADFSSDPMVAGAFVRQMVASPEGAFGMAGQAAQFAPKVPGAIAGAFGRGVDTGVAPGSLLGHKLLQEGYKSQQNAANQRANTEFGARLNAKNTREADEYRHGLGKEMEGLRATNTRANEEYRARLGVLGRTQEVEDPHVLQPHLIRGKPSGASVYMRGMRKETPEETLRRMP